MEILTKLRGLTSSQQFAETLPDLKRQKAAAEAELDRLEGQRETVIFEGGNLAKLNAEIATSRETISTLDVAIEGAERRRKEAAAREHAADVEARMAAAPGLRDRLIAARKRAHILASELDELVDELRSGGRELRELNEFASREGRPDLRAEVPWDEWREKIRQGRVRAWAQERGAASIDALDASPDLPVNLRPGKAVPTRAIEEPALNLPGYTSPAPRDQRDPHWLEIVFPELAKPGAKGGVVQSIKSATSGRRSA